MQRRVLWVSPFRAALIAGLVSFVLSYPMIGIMWVFNLYATNPGVLNWSGLILAPIVLGLCASAAAGLGALSYNLIAKSGLCVTVQTEPALPPGPDPLPAGGDPVKPYFGHIRGSSMRFVLKSVAFTVIFWSLWLLVFRPLSTSLTAGTSGGAQASQSQSADSEALMKKYWEQARAADKLQQRYIEQAARADRFSDRAEEQQRKYSAQLEVQDALAKRYAEVIRLWEQQAGVKK